MGQRKHLERLLTRNSWNEIHGTIRGCFHNVLIQTHWVPYNAVRYSYTVKRSAISILLLYSLKVWCWWAIYFNVCIHWFDVQTLNKNPDQTIIKFKKKSYAPVSVIFFTALYKIRYSYFLSIHPWCVCKWTSQHSRRNTVIKSPCILALHYCPSLCITWISGLSKMMKTQGAGSLSGVHESRKICRYANVLCAEDGADLSAADGRGFGKMGGGHTDGWGKEPCRERD